MPRCLAVVIAARAGHGEYQAQAPIGGIPEVLGIQGANLRWKPRHVHTSCTWLGSL